MNRPESDATSKTARHPRTAHRRGRHARRGAPPFHPAPRSTALGGYRIVKLLGEGGMGAVYHARDDKLDRDVALKTMKPELAAQPEAVERFLREARAAAKVEHDNVVPIWQIGEDNGTPFIAMPLLEGAVARPLAETRAGSAAGRRAEGRARDGRRAGRGARARTRSPRHQARQHLDRGRPAREGPRERSSGGSRSSTSGWRVRRPTTPRLTGTGAVLGTPAYMSPEQARAEPVDHRTDLFSLGVVLYRMTTGTQPFRGASTMALLTSLAVDQPPAPATVNPEVPQALSDLIMRLLAKDRAERPGSAAEVVAELREIGKQLVAAKKLADAGPLPIVVHPVPITQPPAPEFNPFTELDAPAPPPPDADKPKAPATERASPPKRRETGVWVAVGLAALLAVAGVVALVKFSGPKPKTPAPDAPDVTQRDSKPTPPQPGPSQPQIDNDRKAAEWVLSATGRVKVKVGAAVQEAAEAKDLPAGRFELFIVGLPDRGDKVTNAGLTHLKELKSLLELHIQNTAVTDDGLEHLKGLSSLRFLQLEKTKVTRPGVEKLAKALPNCRIVSDHGTIEPKVGDDRAVAEWVLSVGGRVTTVDLGKKTVYVTAAKDLPPGPLTVVIIHLTFRKEKVKDADLERFQGLSGLRNLDLNGTQITNDGLAHLKGLIELRRLSVDATEVTNDGLKHLQGMTQLTQLELSSTKVTGTGLVHLKGLRQLSVLHLNYTQVTDDDVEHLLVFDKLTFLSLLRTKVTAQGVAQLKKALPNCDIQWEPPKK